MPKACEHSEAKTAAAVWRVGERGGGAALFAKKCDLINANNLAESRRSERAENVELVKDSNDFIESLKDFNVIDCHEVVPTSRNDDSAIDCHANPCGFSRNDASFTVFARKSVRADEAIHKSFYKIKRLY